MSDAIELKAQRWLKAKNLDSDTRSKLNQMLHPGNREELEEAFYKDLEFGTGGLRGIMGIGSNRMNKYTVGKATQGLCNYLKMNFPESTISVAVAHDSRNNSPEFARVCADIFSANGIKVYLFDGLRPTPELSFTIRYFGCKSGVVLTASHNPKEYNGYKAYWEDGAQVTPPHDSNIIDEVNKIENLDEINFESNPDLIETIGTEIDKKYLETIYNLSLSRDSIERQSDLGIVFSPIHGTASVLVPNMLKEMGFKNVSVVEEQMEPNGNFPTVVYPNPEESEALSMAIDLAEKENAELIMATDPDADRVGIAVKNPEGSLELLNGNQTGALLIGYLLERWSGLNKFQGNEYVVKTIVTTELIKSIADHYDVKCYDTLTGFKYIATLIRELEGKEKFIGGGEESYGYLIGDKVRDKDAIASCAMIAEMCAYYKDQGKSLFDQLLSLYQKHGFYREALFSLTRKGKQGAEEINLMMKAFRETPPKSFGGSPVILIKDYQTGEQTSIIDNIKSNLDFPKSNVLQFFTEDGTKISARPSGTEPKIKFYIGCVINNFYADDYQDFFVQAAKKIERIKLDLGF